MAEATSDLSTEGTAPPKPGAVERSAGSTPAERYLQRLCERSFLKLWSHPCVYQDDGLGQRGQGKELCDLLVVFKNDILIFSDKDCAFPTGIDLHTAWCRWYKRAVLGGAKQIWGAERRIKMFPDQLYLDRKCQTKFPFPLPDPAQARFHRIIVTHGASAACHRFFGGGSGSLMLDSTLVGDKAHLRPFNEGGKPFTLGQPDPSKGFVHVFDDTSLHVVMDTLDTVSDFVSYLAKKERFFKRIKAVWSAGEEELLSVYLKDVDATGEHDFILPGEYDAIGLEEGHWTAFREHPQRLAQIQADQISYAWDRLIEKFSYHAMTRTQYTSPPGEIEDTEQSLRFLAAENRTRRRMLASAARDVALGATDTRRFTRLVRGIRPFEPYYVFLAMPSKWAPSEERYREVRQFLLTQYCFACKDAYPDALDIVGLAYGPACEEFGSEDLMALDCRDWTPEMAAESASARKELGLLANPIEIRSTYSEYPPTKR